MTTQISLEQVQQSAETDIKIRAVQKAITAMDLSELAGFYEAVRAQSSSWKGRRCYKTERAWEALRWLVRNDSEHHYDRALRVIAVELKSRVQL